MNNKNTINNLTKILDKLLRSKAIKYKDWKPREYRRDLKDGVGVYHFFRQSGEEIESLYVGKAGFGDNNRWDLYERLKQHFQTSQKNTILGKYAKASSISTEEAKIELNDSSVKVQWLKINGKGDLERKLMRVECFCKAVLNPKFTDQ